MRCGDGPHVRVTRNGGKRLRPASSDQTPRPCVRPVTQFADQRSAQQLADTFQIQRTHIGREARRIAGPQGKQTDRARLPAQRNQSHRLHGRRRIAEPRQHAQIIDRAAVWLGAFTREDPDAFLDRREDLTFSGQHAVPETQRHIGHGERLGQLLAQGIHHGIEAAGRQQSQRQRMHARRNQIVVFAEMQQFRQFDFERLGFFAQRQDLPLGDGDGATAVRVRNVELRQQIVIILEELRVILQVTRDVIGSHASITPDGCLLQKR